MSNQLETLIKPCASGTCPAIYKDEQNRLYIQGSKLGTTARQEIAIADHEEVVEISGDLLEFLRTL
ncbi:MAG: hypothetical protein F6K42_21605 [Leptolyngbya sp. SIO1D8]|nr:hypothetical protein [Leptolyngbya sp. SIO1D8]